jgi:hypothetical protein
VTSIEEESSEQSSLEVERGDVYNFEQGSILYIQSYPNASRQRLRIYAIFTSEGINADDPSVMNLRSYSSFRSSAMHCMYTSVIVVCQINQSRSPRWKLTPASAIWSKGSRQTFFAWDLG